jgi:hypothetical protein
VVRNRYVLLLELTVRNSCTLNDTKIVAIKIGWFCNRNSQATQHISNWNCLLPLVLLVARAERIVTNSVVYVEVAMQPWCLLGHKTGVLPTKTIIPVMERLIKWWWAWLVGIKKYWRFQFISYHMWQDLHDNDKTCMQSSYWELILENGQWLGCWITDGLCALPVTDWTGIHGFG